MNLANKQDQYIEVWNRRTFCDSSWLLRFPIFAERGGANEWKWILTSTLTAYVRWVMTLLQGDASVVKLKVTWGQGGGVNRTKSRAD